MDHSEWIFGVVAARDACLTHWNAGFQFWQLYFPFSFLLMCVLGDSR